MSKGAEVRVARREWLAELRAARDEGETRRVADLLTEIAVQAPELQGAACEVVRGNNDAGAVKREEWARGFFISRTPQLGEEATTTQFAPGPGVVVLQRFGRRIGTKPAGLEEMVAELAERVAEPEADEAKSAEAEPEQEEAEAETAAWAIQVEFSANKPINDDEPALLTADASYDHARVFAQRKCWKLGMLGVYYWRGGFWEWDGRVYKQLPELDLRAKVYGFLDVSRKRSKGLEDGTTRFRPKPKDTNALLDGLKAGLTLPSSCEPSTWLDTGEHAGEVMMFQNGMVELESRLLVPATPKLWVQGGVGYDWDPLAQCPLYDAYQETIFPSDQEAKDCFDEWLGLNMTEDISFQKGMMCVGPPRSGKGTMFGIIEALIGAEAYMALDMEKWQAGENSMERLIARKALVFPDVRLRPAKWWGQRFDPGGMDYVSVQHQLKIIGGDIISIGKKWEKLPYTGRLPGHITMGMNQVPNFNDAVLACTRFRRHRVRCFDGAGGVSWRDGSLLESSSLRRCG